MADELRYLAHSRRVFLAPKGGKGVVVRRALGTSPKIARSAGPW
jgi:hypothetical protein